MNEQRRGRDLRHSLAGLDVQAAKVRPAGGGGENKEPQRKEGQSGAVEGPLEEEGRGVSREGREEGWRSWGTCLFPI